MEIHQLIGRLVKTLIKYAPVFCVDNQLIMLRIVYFSKKKYAKYLEVIKKGCTFAPDLKT